MTESHGNLEKKISSYRSTHLKRNFTDIKIMC